MDTRTWRWFQARLYGLTLESRTWSYLIEVMRGSTASEASVDDLDRELGITRE
ncbi:hypothetical protein [Actinosynnema mirum]|uniref:Uncharacterized protein n=1 Tax=Actinosynnema mirum (strain ATCC 29888 / DSM 43827 / JCM 3225 / NBRC 14064 / NCIMB 13271 / NRRL B-12336 / IMRU 3971 / 101) TaxID=446462 RepID=C6WBL3_ACTMD|nr:hypothetical protein [Actinosynnema mirum]ACU35581.1 hypothetical protein Amir_1632 [Actinosynnema mirum DSM 43827]